MTKEFIQAYSADKQTFNGGAGPPQPELAKVQRDTRRAALQAHAADVWAGSRFGLTACCYCTYKRHGAAKCRTRGGTSFNHGPVVDQNGRAGPDVDVGHFPLDAFVVCARPAFQGRITAFNAETGQHTLTQTDGQTRVAYLAYLFKHCTVTPGANPQTCACPIRHWAALAAREDGAPAAPAAVPPAAGAVANTTAGPTVPAAPAPAPLPAPAETQVVAPPVATPATTSEPAGQSVDAGAGAAAPEPLPSKSGSARQPSKGPRGGKGTGKAPQPSGAGAASEVATGAGQTQAAERPKRARRQTARE